MTKENLVKALAAKLAEREHLVSDWYEDHNIYELNNVLMDLESNIWLTGTDNGIEVGFFSGKICRNIILDSDAYHSCETVSASSRRPCE